MTEKEQMSFYRTHAARLYNICMRILHDSGAAEEVMQEVILKYLTSDVAVFSDAQTAAWLDKTCIRRCVDVLRKKRREKAFLDEYAAGSCSYEEPLLQNVDMTGVEVERVRKAMAELDENYRLVLTLVLIDGLDYEEIAQLTGESRGAVRTRYSRAKNKLLEKLGKV